MHKEAITAIMFDYNGVIADTDNHDIKSVRFACEKMGLAPPSNYNKYFSGKTLKDGFTQYLQQLITTGVSVAQPIEETLKQLTIYKSSCDIDYPENIIPYQDTLRFIETLPKCFHLALVTGARRVLIDMALKKLNLADSFNVIVTPDDYVLGKPNPESYLHAISLLGVNPDQAVGIEDHPLGVKAVKSSGAACIAVTQTHSSEELQEADLVVNSLMDSRVSTWLSERS